MYWKKWEKTIGSLKFAVVIITLFSIAMIVGTFCESYYGTEFANRLIYKRPPFMLLQLAMFLSIIYAAFLRLPPKPRLYGFYTIHTGLVIIGCGSFITYHSGIDGQITLYPNTPTRTIVLNKDQLHIKIMGKGEMISYDLPYTPFEANIDTQFKNIRLGRFYPFSENQLEWTPPQKTYPTNEVTQSSEYSIYNDNIEQQFILSLHPEATDYSSNIQMGPLEVHYLPATLANCFEKKSESGIIIWSNKSKNCFLPEDRGLKVQATSSGKRFLVLRQDGEFYSFFPDFSPFPMTKDFNLVEDSDLRVFSKTLFENKPNLFLFGKMAAFFNDKQWSVHPIEELKSVELPWMGLRVQLLRHSEGQVPKQVPHPVLPVQKDGKIIHGEQKTLEIFVDGKRYWLTDQKTLSLNPESEPIHLSLGKESIRLPFELALTQFKMDTDPGTNSHASYESFVRLFDSEGPKNHHVYMNSPLKYADFTFYQASYFESESGHYGSVLSANVDPGRPFKYFGCLLLVLGAIWHFYLKGKKVTAGASKDLSSEQVGATT